MFHSICNYARGVNRISFGEGVGFVLLGAVLTVILMCILEMARADRMEKYLAEHKPDFSWFEPVKVIKVRYDEEVWLRRDGEPRSMSYNDRDISNLLWTFCYDGGRSSLNDDLITKKHYEWYPCSASEKVWRPSKDLSLELGLSEVGKICETSLNHLYELTEIIRRLEQAVTMNRETQQILAPSLNSLKEAYGAILASLRQIVTYFVLNGALKDYNAVLDPESQEKALAILARNAKIVEQARDLLPVSARAIDWVNSGQAESLDIMEKLEHDERVIRILIGTPIGGPAGNSTGSLIGASAGSPAKNPAISPAGSSA